LEREATNISLVCFREKRKIENQKEKGRKNTVDPPLLSPREIRNAEIRTRIAAPASFACCA
jgi:hypothetical protein